MKTYITVNYANSVEFDQKDVTWYRIRVYAVCNGIRTFFPAGYPYDLWSAVHA